MYYFYTLLFESFIINSHPTSVLQSVLPEANPIARTIITSINAKVQRATNGVRMKIEGIKCF